MRFVIAALLLLAQAACAPKEDRASLARRPLTTASENGWARLPLDGDAQRHFPQLWLGDAEGHAIPFLVEREGLWQPRRLDLARQLLGRDEHGNPTAEFVLKFPEGWQLREREQLQLDLDLAGPGPWVCRVEVQRRLEDGPPISLERDPPLHVYDLGDSGSSSSFRVPWDAKTYRITLRSAQGKAPSIKGITATAVTGTVATDAALVPAELIRLQEQWTSSQPGEVWRARLPAPERIVGLELALKAPVAPLRPLLRVPEQTGKEPRRAFSYPAVHGLLWHLPALETRSSRVAITPTLTDELGIGLPEGARLESVQLLVQRDVLLFPAEAGARYFLHQGGEVKRAPGNLAALPDSSRAVYGRQPLALGLAEADPQGLPVRMAAADQAAERSRPWLPWVAGTVVLALAYAAFRLLKGPDHPNPHLKE